MAVDPYQPQSKYHGQDRQDWQIERQRLERPQAPSPTSAVTSSSVPNSTGSQGCYVSSGADSIATGSNTGIVDSLCDSLGNLASWMVRRIWPLQACVDAGDTLLKTPWKFRLPIAIVSGFVGIVVLGPHQAAMWPTASQLLVSVTGDSAPVVVIAIAGVAGWLLPSIVGLSLTSLAYLTGLVIGLSLLGLLVALAYGIVAYTEGWPPFVPSGYSSSSTQH